MEIRDWIGFLGLGVTLTLFIYTRAQLARHDVKEDLDAIKANFGKLEGRIVKMEERISSMPTLNSLHALELSMRDLKGAVQVQQNATESIVIGMRRIEHFLDAVKFKTPVKSKSAR
jgi:hypothetical protein